MGLPTSNLMQEMSVRPKPSEQRAAVSGAKAATAQGLPPPAALPLFSAGGLPENAPRPSSMRPEASARRLDARRPAHQQHAEATAEVSLADVSLASVPTELTEDISLQDVEFAASEVANDADRVVPQELHIAASDASLSDSDLLAPSGRSKRWLWALGALPLLLGAGYVALAARPASDTGARESALVGDPGAAHAPATASVAASAKIEAPVPSAPEPSPAVAAPAVEAAPLPPAVAEGDVKPALEAAQPSSGAAGTAPDEEAAEEAGTADPPEVEAEKHEELDAARRVALKRADGLVSQASALRKRRRLEPARSKYRAALAAYPGHPRALYGLVQLAIQQHDGKQAVQLARELVEGNPDQVSYLVLLGDAYRAAGKPNPAREAWLSAARKGSTVARKRLK